MKYAIPTKIYHHGYYKLQNKNKKMLPGLQLKPASTLTPISVQPGGLKSVNEQFEMKSK